jgi:hypothetical protein
MRHCSFSVLYGFWVANYAAFNGDVVCSLAADFLAAAEKRRATVPLMIGHRIMGASLLYTGDITQGREHQDLAIKLYDPVEHGALATRFGVDIEVQSCRIDLWPCGYLVILSRRLWTPTARSRLRARTVRMLR